MTKEQVNTTMTPSAQTNDATAAAVGHPENDPNHEQKQSQKSKRPLNTEFRQQRLKSWQPILTPKKVIPFLFLIAIIFIPLGIVFTSISSNVQEIVIDYTYCLRDANEAFTYPPDTVAYQWRLVNGSSEDQKSCQLKFPILSDISGPVYLYYRLTHYFQNHRLYVKSVVPDQLLGQALTFNQLSDCDPLIGPPGFDALGNARPVYYPCGLIANSVFNDTIGDPVRMQDNQTFDFTQSDIIWSYDKNKYGPTQYSLFGTPPIVAPPFWNNPDMVFPNGTYRRLPDLSSDVHLMVWMRTAGLPNFRKLYGTFQSTLPKGTYTVTIDSVFEVTSFGGTKAIVISNNSFLGGKNSFIGITYIVIGGVFLFFALCFLLRHMVAPRALGDARYLSWNRNQTPSTR